MPVVKIYNDRMFIQIYNDLVFFFKAPVPFGQLLQLKYKYNENLRCLKTLLEWHKHTHK